MKLNADHLAELVQLAISAAREAGALIASYAHRTVAVETKAGGSSRASQVVTEVDLLCQDMILKALNPTFESFDLGLLTEELEDDFSRFEKGYFWCIDPLDGTLPFVESTPGYAVSIALVSRDGTPVIGVVFDPVEQTLYHAVRGQGTFRNTQPWNLTSAANTFTLITDRSFVQQPDYAEQVTKVEGIAAKLGYTDVKTVLFGGSVMNACWVLEQAAGCYYKLPKPQNGGGSVWDFAATACIFREMGAVATDMSGAALELNRRGSTFMNHRGILFASDESIAAAIKIGCGT